MLILPIKLEWLCKIITLDKLEEYREIKPYWTKRLQTIGLLDENGNPTTKTTNVILRNGYGAGCIEAEVRVTIRKGTGRTEWGAKPGEKYYILTIREIVNINSPDELRNFILKAYEHNRRQKLFGG